MTEVRLVNHRKDSENEFDTKEEAQEQRNNLISLGVSPEDLEIIENGEEPPEEETKDERQSTQSESESDAKEPEIVQEVAADPSEVENLPDEIEPQAAEFEPVDMSVETDPLEILPDYMIDHVKDTPTLNKRGLSVLAYHYGVTVEDRAIIVSPHDSEWEYAIVETTVTNADGNTFVGTGTAHVDRGDEKEVILELAETRSYKRAVSFATGTGIVSYQELSGELE